MPDDVLGRPLATRPDVPRVDPSRGSAAGPESTPDAAVPVPAGGLGWPGRSGDPGRRAAPARLGWAVVDVPVTASATPAAGVESPAATPGPEVVADAANVADVADAVDVTGAVPVRPPDVVPPPAPGPASPPTDGAPLAAGSESSLGVVDGWWATLAGAPLPDTLLGDGGLAGDGLDLTQAHPSGLATLLAGRPTRLSSLVREPAMHSTARARARVIRAGVTELASERGVRAGWLALGLVSWWAADGAQPRRDGRSTAPVRAPLLLRGCSIVPRGAGHEDYELELDHAVVVNPEVLRRLREDHRVRLDADALGGLAFGPDGFDPAPVFAHLEQVCAGVPGFAVDRRLVVGSFTAGSGALLSDLDAAAPALQGHPVLGGIVDGRRRGPSADRSAGPDAGRTAGEAGPDRPFVSTDEMPDPVLSVLPLDPAQRRAVRAVRDGGSVVVQGPPGTGRTQTLAAAVVALAEAGQRVLVVTPHRSSAATLTARIAGTGLRDLVLDLHDGHGDQPAVLAALGDDLEAAATGSAVDRAQKGARLAGDGDAAAVLVATSVLTGASAALHAVRGPWGVSAYDAMEALAALMATDVAPRTRVRLSPAVCATLDAAARERLAADLRAAADLGAFTLTRRDTRWLDAAVHSAEEAEQALAAAVAARDGLAAARPLMAGLAEAAGLEPASTVAGWRPQLELLRGVRSTLDVMLPAVYEQPVAELVAGTGPSSDAADRPGLLARRSLRRRARALVRPGVHVPDLHAVLVAAAEQRAAWQESARAGGWPRVPVGLAAAGDAVDTVEAALATLTRFLEGTATPELDTLPLDALARRLGDLAADGASLADQPARSVLVGRLREAGLADLVADLRERRCIADDVDGELDLAWWTSVLESIIRGDPRLARHDPAQLASALEELRGAADRLSSAGVARVREVLAERAHAVVEASPEQVRWLRAEIYRGHRSQWPGDLFRRAGDVVRALRPVLVMSPDAVARTLPAAVAGRPLFDVVVVDDAGQVGMPEAAASLARGRRFVVAGDPAGLPPATGRPSVLEALAGRLPVHVLDRDHRVRDGRLLAPARRGYPGAWAATPGASASPPLAFEHVWVAPGELDGVVPDPADDPSEPEVRRVVELVREHAVRRPGESLLVVTLGRRHADRIEDALRSAVAARPDLARWLEVHWTGGIAEPFAIRPVHRLCGLERDAVVLSLGLPRTPHGRVVHKFGVLDGPYGRACLTAALTRARRRTTIVSAFEAGDLDPARLRSDGARMLADTLALVGDPRLRGDHIADADAPGRTPDPLVADLRDRLAAVGLPVRAGIDAPDWPLSLVVADATDPRHLLLAVDVDGEQHAACPSVVVRDATRREAFERAGWAYVRVASMDLFCDPAGEVERIRRAWRAAGGRGPNETPTTGTVIIGRPKVRATRPDVPAGRPVREYTAEQLRDVAAWVLTDGVPRSVDELVAGVCEDLQLVVRGPRVEALVAAAARDVLGEGTLEG